MLTAVCFFQITALKIKHNPFAKAFLDAKERLRPRTPLTPQWVKLACSHVASNPVFLIAGVTIKKCPIIAQTVNSLDILNVSTGWHLCIKADAGCYMYIFYSDSFHAWLSCTRFSSTVGGWFIPGQSPICPSSSPPQFSSTTGHSSGSYCERYSSLRSHRAAPYPSHYPHRTTSTSKTPSQRTILMK